MLFRVMLLALTFVTAPAFSDGEIFDNPSQTPLTINGFVLPGAGAETAPSTPPQCTEEGEPIDGDPNVDCTGSIPGMEGGNPFFNP